MDGKHPLMDYPVSIQVHENMIIDQYYLKFVFMIVGTVLIDK